MLLPEPVVGQPWNMPVFCPANDIEFSGERKRVRCNEMLAAVPDIPMEEPRACADDRVCPSVYFVGTSLISKRPEEIRANTHSASFAHFAECSVLAGISE